MFHGMMIYDPHVFEFMMRTVLDDKIQDVYSDPRFPQFRDSESAALSVYTEFKGCQPGYIDEGATALIVKNCCEKAKVTITSITANGLDLNFRITPKSLNPGETVEIPFTGEIPAVSKKLVDITVTYLFDTVTPAGYRVQSYTLMNGDDVDFDGGYVTVHESLLNKLIGPVLSGILKKLGLNEFLSMIYNVVYYWFNSMTKIFA